MAMVMARSARAGRATAVRVPRKEGLVMKARRSKMPSILVVVVVTNTVVVLSCGCGGKKEEDKKDDLRKP